MRENFSLGRRHIDPSYRVCFAHRLATAAGLGLVLMATCASGARAGGSGLGFVTSMGGSLGSSGVAIALDGSGNIYIGGNFDGMVDFDPGPGVASRTGKGHGDIFICKLDSSGSFLGSGRWAI